MTSIKKFLFLLLMFFLLSSCHKSREIWLFSSFREPATVNVWAPELFYDDDNDQFIII